MQVSVIVDRPVDDVWKFVTDPSNHWDPGSLEMKQVSPGPPEVGAIFKVLRASYPREMDFRLAQYEPNRKFTFEVDSGPIRGSRFEYDLEAVEEKTKLTEIADYDMPGFFKLLSPIFGREGKIRSEGMGRVGTVKALLESEARL